MTTPGRGGGLPVVKAHAYGNDFLYAPADAAPEAAAPLARALCSRRTGIGADGLVLYQFTDEGAVMRLLNADGSPSEVSGNGVRGLAALVLDRRPRAAGSSPQVGESVRVQTDAGMKTLTLVAIEGPRMTFEAAMGQPTELGQVALQVAGEALTACVMNMGNPQCVVLGPLPDDVRFERIGPALSTHRAFPAGTNVEFAEVLARDRVRIRIWERGVGPTQSSGTGSSASAVAAAAFGGAARDVIVEAPGGSQRVNWREDGVMLTGWAELLFEGVWRADAPGTARAADAAD